MIQTKQKSLIPGQLQVEHPRKLTIERNLLQLKKRQALQGKSQHRSLSDPINAVIRSFLPPPMTLPLDLIRIVFSRVEIVLWMLQMNWSRT